MNLFKSSLILLLGLVYINANAAKLESEKEKLSYAMGAYFGQTVTQQNLDVDIPAFLQAVEDVLKGADPKLTPQEMQKVLSDYQRKEQEERAAQSGKNKEKGDKFLAENGKKEGVVTLESGLQYKVITEGKGKKPTADNFVSVHYRGTLIDGTEFDSSYSRGEPAEFPVGGVIKGWQEALQLMTVGSKWQLFIPSELAYSERSPGGSIGPNETLLFEVELLEIK